MVLFKRTSDDRDTTITTIIDLAITNRPDGTAGSDSITPEGLVGAAAAYGIVITVEDAATRIYARAAHRGQ